MTVKELEQKVADLEKKIEDLKVQHIENHYHYSYPQYNVPYYPNYPRSTGVVYCTTAGGNLQDTTGFINGGVQ